MDHLVEYWIPLAIVVGTLLGAMLTPLVGYFRRPRNGHHSHSTFHGTAMFDASVAKDLLAQMVELVIQTRRIAEAAEDLVEVERGRDKRKAAERHDAVLVSKIEALQEEITDLKRDKR